MSTATQQLAHSRDRIRRHLVRSTVDDPQQHRRARSRRRQWVGVAVLVGAVALVPAVWLISRQLPLDVWRADLRTATGEGKKVQLADGSSLQFGGRFFVHRQRLQRRTIEAKADHGEEDREDARRMPD